MSNTASDLPIGHELTEGSVHHAVVVYGTETCHDTTRSRALLERMNVPYNFYNIDLDAGINKTAQALASGSTKIPVVDLGGGSVLVEPSDESLTLALRDSGRI